MKAIVRNHSCPNIGHGLELEHSVFSPQLWQILCLDDQWCQVCIYKIINIANYVRYFYHFPALPRHVGLSVGGAVIGKFIDEKKEIALAERDAQLKHYIELHPDDFPEPSKNHKISFENNVEF